MLHSEELEELWESNKYTVESGLYYRKFKKYIEQ